MIETGVDRLISLVEERKRISLKDAAKELAVDINMVKEWAGLIEDDRIGVEYKFTTPFLVIKDVSPKQESIDKLHVEREEHFKKIEKSIGSLDEHRTGLEQAKERISGLKDELNQHITILQKETKTKDKSDLSEKEAELKKYFLQRINAVSKKLMEEEKIHEEFAKKIKEETETLKESFKSIATHMKQTADWISYFKQKEEEQENKIKEMEKLLKRK